MSGPAPVKVLANASELIEVLAEHGPRTPADIAADTGVPRPSVYRLVEALSAIALVETLPDSRVRLTSRWLHLADAARAGMDEWSDAPEVLERLVAETAQTAFLTVRRDDRAICIDWRQGRGIGLLVLKPGRSLPLHAGAAGRTLLAYGGDAGRVLDGAPFPPLTARTLTSRIELEADVEKTLDVGFVLSDEDVTPGIGALGVPVLGDDGALRGCLSLGGLSGEVRARKDELVAALRSSAAAMVREA